MTSNSSSSASFFFLKNGNEPDFFELPFSVASPGFDEAFPAFDDLLKIFHFPFRSASARSRFIIFENMGSPFLITGRRNLKILSSENSASTSISPSSWPLSSRFFPEQQQTQNAYSISVTGSRESTTCA
jgi:hypothetical protein